MKRSKKLLSLVMAMLMAFSLMAVPAAAYGGGDGIDPHGPGGSMTPKICPICGSTMAWNGSEYVCYASHHA